MIAQTLLLLSMIGYIILYLSSRKYLENFRASSSASASAPYPSSYKTITPPEKPYTRSPINSVDDYELSAVYQRQGSKEATKEQLDQAMAQYPMDWAVQGQGSQHYQEKEAQYKASQQARRADGVEGFYSEALTDQLLPDGGEQEAEERKILQTYKPEKSANLLNYSVDDVQTLVEKLYDKRGLIPEVVPSKQGPNVWEIVDVREKNPKIIWEDDPSLLQHASERDRMIARREEVIDVPYMASDLAAGLDPFFQKGQVTRDGRFNYHQWTPGLERMFAPTHPIKEWH